jgi:hypothetical protein
MTKDKLQMTEYPSHTTRKDIPQLVCHLSFGLCHRAKGAPGASPYQCSLLTTH